MILWYELLYFIINATNRRNIANVICNSDVCIRHSVNSDEDRVEYLQFKADGSFVNVQDDEDGINIQHGTWKLTDNEIILRIQDGKLAGSTFTYTVSEIGTDKLTVSMWGVTAYLIRVPDSEIEKYL